MPTQLTRQCQPADPAQNPPGPCKATFTANGRAGNQKLLGGGMVALQADEPLADAYSWEVTSSPPSCDYLLTGATQPQARLVLPGPGAYVVQLTVTKGACSAQHRVILWVATAVNLYRLPASSEPLRFDGKAEWAGDLAAALLNLDVNLPTPAQKAALEEANQPGAGNPFATLRDLGGSPGPSSGDLTADELAAIRAAEQPDENNRFVTDSDRKKLSPTAEQKAALDEAAGPDEDNPFVTESRLQALAPTPDQKAALDEAEEPSRANAFITNSLLERLVPTPEQRGALDRSEAPATGNPFVTESRLSDLELPLDQRAALNRAWDPSVENPFATVSHVQAFAPSADQRAALSHAVEPKADNPFVTLAHLQDYAPTPDQRGALNRAVDPAWDNPFVTERRLAEAAPTPDQRAALNRAADPGWDNPLVTASHLHRFMPTPEQKEALDSAQSPDADNPFVTASRLKELAPTANQKAGLDAADAPGASNPFVTRSSVPSPQLTDAELDAIQHAQAPGSDNPFITRSALPPDELAPALKAALVAADQPGKDNPFVTRSALPPDELTPEQKAALAAAEAPGAHNPFITRSVLPAGPVPGQWPLGLSDTQDAALDAADAFPDPHKPGAENPFVTRSMLTDGAASCDLSEEQCAAIQAASSYADPHKPDAGNPFVTQSMLPDDPAPPVWPIGLTAAQDAALDAADAFPDPHKPGAGNPFVTQSMLPGDPPPLVWPIGLTAAQDAALDAADAFPDPHKPGAGNPFVTQSMLPDDPAPSAWPIGLTAAQDAALDAAEAFPDPHKPSAENPFVTRSMLTGGDASCDLSDDQCAAIRAASSFPDPHKPDAANPFVTQTMLPNDPAPTQWPIGLSLAQDDALDAAEAYPGHTPGLLNPFLTQSRWDETAPTLPQKAALDAASAHPVHPPSANNPLATLADLGQAGFTTRVVAAGSLDLQANTAGPTVGGLKVVATTAASGLATLSFDGYTHNRADHYLVKALPINGQAGVKLDSLTVAQLVEFTAQGFVLHMAQPLAGATNLGRCMIEVSEMLEAAAPAETRLEQAIRLYYALIQQQRYGDAWPMASQRYRNAHGQRTFDWTQAEQAIPGFDVNIRKYWSELVLHLNRNGARLDAAAVQNFWYRVFHLSAAGGDPHPNSPVAWQESRLDQDLNRLGTGVWHVNEKDGREKNPDWYRCVVYSGKPPAWPNPGAPIAWSGDFQLPAKGNEQAITIELNPVSRPLDLAGFTRGWQASGPAKVKALQRVSASAGRATYDLDLHDVAAGRDRRLQVKYERGGPGVEGHSRFDYWLFTDETVLP